MDDLVRNFDYKEKLKVFEYYPQYYHKTDKVSRTWLRTSIGSQPDKITGWTASIHRAIG